MSDLTRPVVDLAGLGKLSLTELEDVIARNLPGWLLVGGALAVIRDQRKYTEEGFTSFDTWLDARGLVKRSYAHELIQATKVVERLSAIADSQPTTEGEIRAVARLPERAWEPVIRKALEAAQQAGELLGPSHWKVAAREWRAREVRRESEERAAQVLPLPSDPRNGTSYHVDCADCLDWFRAQPPDSVDLVFGSPPYEKARLYLEGGKDLDIARDTSEWVAWMVEVYRAALRCCKGLVAFVVEGQTKDYCWSAAPALLITRLVEAGIAVRKPPIYHRVGIPGSGGPDWLRNDYEFIVCTTRGGPLPWSDNTAMGHEPKYEPGGEPSHRTVDGSRVNGEGVGYATMDDRNNVGPHRARQRAGRVYQPPERANPGNVIRCVAGGGNMGHPLCHENEAPFPEDLARFFVLSFCPKGGVVCDPFSGSGTTASVAIENHRRFRGCDLRPSQVELTLRRLAQTQPFLPTLEG